MNGCFAVDLLSIAVQHDLLRAYQCVTAYCRVTRFLLRTELLNMLLWMLTSVMLMPAYHFSICFFILNWCFVVLTSIYWVDTNIMQQHMQRHVYAVAKQVKNKNYYVLYIARHNDISIKLQLIQRYIRFYTCKYAL